VLFVICLIVPVAGALLIYLRYNLGALELLQIPPNALFAIDGSFFRYLLRIQGSFAFLVAVFVGPGLVSPDLTNNGLALYLSRPFSRVDYVLGKLAVLFILQSLVTWVPLTILYLLQWNLAGNAWMFQNFRVLIAILLGSWVWILLLSLLALSISAWVRWKTVAGAAMFGVFFVGAGVGSVIKLLFVTAWGDLFHLNRVVQAIWSWLFMGQTGEVEVIRGVEVSQLPVWSAWIMLVFVCGACLLLLAKKVRAYEVVR
jgi:ABC-2 type transport system permease protein